MSSRRPELDHVTAARLGATEYDRCTELFRSLEPDDWDKPTDCPAWTVRDMACHMLGAIEMAASISESLRVQRAAAKAGGPLVDAMTAIQVSEREGWTPTRIVATFESRGPVAARRRKARPGVIRLAPVTTQRINGQPEGWTLGYMVDVIFTRDPWMHRVDVSRAVGRPMVLTADHDGVLVADVVVEWLGRHNQPVDLTLDGPAGGRWQQGTGGPTVQLDAVEFCRVLSGRPAEIQPADLLATEVPF